MSAILKFFKPAPPRYYTPERTKDEIVVHLDHDGKGPDVVPSELQTYIPSIIWNERLPAISRVVKQYYKPTAERIYTLFSMLTTIFLPIGLYHILMASMVIGNLDDEHSTAAFFQAKAISFAMFIGVGLVLLVPMAIWKFVGRRHMNRMLVSWAAEDRRTQGLSAVIPTWKVKMPGIFSTRTTLAISLPRLTRSTSAFGFQSDNYVSAYINTHGKQDNAFVPSIKAKGTHMSVIGELPLFTPTKTTFNDSKV